MKRKTLITPMVVLAVAGCEETVEPTEPAPTAREATAEVVQAALRLEQGTPDGWAVGARDFRADASRYVYAPRRAGDACPVAMVDDITIVTPDTCVAADACALTAVHAAPEQPREGDAIRPQLLHTCALIADRQDVDGIAYAVITLDRPVAAAR